MRKETTYTNAHKGGTTDINNVSKPVRFIDGQIVDVDVPRGTIFGGKPNFPIITDTEPIRQTAFYKWLEAEHTKGTDVNRFVDTVKRYTKSERPFINRTDGHAHKAVFQVYWSDVLN